VKDAGKVVDGVVQLRRLMTSLDSASYALERLGDAALSQRLSEDADQIMETLERLERSPEYKRARKDYFSDQTDA